jgi:hypothetical protein
VEGGIQMPRYIALLSLLATFTGTCLLPGVAHAQATRTWVSGVGDDANPCSRTAPCKTFAGAISKTAAGGEIDALDPAGFGALTITKAITIDGGGGQVASVLVSGTNGINVNAGATDVVILRNLRINGLSGSGINGIAYNSGGALHIESCDIFGFGQNGILVATTQPNATLFVNDTFLQDSGNGVQIAPTGGNVRSMLNRVRANGNSGVGFYNNPSGAGAGTSIIDSSAAVNGTGVGITGGTVWLGNDVIIRNGIGVVFVGGTLSSYKNNMIDGNSGGDGTPITGTPLN